MKKNILIPCFILVFSMSSTCWADSAAQGATPEAQKSVPVETVHASSPSSASNPGIPLERAKGEKLATAMGYYARSRALLISALREFDKGLALVDPNALVDSRMWRTSIMDRADELTRVLDPQPRATKSGIKYGNETVRIGDAGKR